MHIWWQASVVVLSGIMVTYNEQKLLVYDEISIVT
jgi:hypothetical protein